MNEFKFADLQVDQIESFDVTVSELMMNSFREISGDTNPLHSDRNFAVQNNYKDKVVFGLLVSSFYSRLVGVYLPGKYALLNSINVDFLKTVYVNDKLYVEGKIVKLDCRFKIINIKSKIIRQNKDIVSIANIRVSTNE
jgi:3-hydroxybutyryl-CoA dehydratase